MTNDVEVFLSISTDNVGKSRLQHLKESLKQIRGIQNIYLVGRSDTADITAFARWNEAEIPNLINQIQRISGISSVEGKTLVLA